MGLAPVAVPQAPLQLNVRGQLSGSVPLPLSVTDAPLALVPFTVWLAPAFSVVSAAVTAAKALINPDPSMLFGTPCEIPGSATALLVMKLRRFVRATAGVFTVELESRHGEDCRTSAATLAA